MDPADWAAAQLRERILAGEYEAGACIPSERDLTRQLGIGRAYVRHALRRLAEERLLVRDHARTPRVALRQERPVIAVFHTRVEDWLLHEAFPLLQGTLGRLEDLGYPCERIAYYASAADAHTKESNQRLIHISETAATAEQFAAVVFLESPPILWPSVRALGERKHPLAVANMETPQPVWGTCVNHRRVMARAVEILVAEGHRRIGYITRDPTVNFYGAALEGYRDGLRAAGLPLREEYVGLASFTDALGGYRAMQTLLTLPERPTAVVCARDVLAQGAWQAVEEEGLTVGYDVSLVGYDNLTWTRRDRPLTTFEEPAYALGAGAVDMALDQLHNGWRPPEQRELDAPLIVRRSMGLPPREGVVSGHHADAVRSVTAGG